jgi:hypothetical protein
VLVDRESSPVEIWIHIALRASHEPRQPLSQLPRQPSAGTPRSIGMIPGFWRPDNGENRVKIRLWVTSGITGGLLSYRFFRAVIPP